MCSAHGVCCGLRLRREQAPRRFGGRIWSLLRALLASTNASPALGHAKRVLPHWRRMPTPTTARAAPMCSTTAPRYAGWLRISIRAVPRSRRLFFSSALASVRPAQSHARRSAALRSLDAHRRARPASATALALAFRFEGTAKESRIRERFHSDGADQAHRQPLPNAPIQCLRTESLSCLVEGSA